MSDERTRQREELERQLEEERQFRARVHRHMGMTAAILVLVAIGVALYQLNKQAEQIGFSVWEALGLGATTLPWILLILGLGVVFSMGTTRIMLGVDWVVKRIRGKKAGG